MRSELQGAAECRRTSGCGPHLLRDVELLHHSELVVHLYAALHQLKLREGQVTEVKLIDFVFLGIWKFSLLDWSGVQWLRREHSVLPGPSPGLLREAKQGEGILRVLLRQGQAAYQDLSQFLLLAFPRLFPVHLSGFLSCPRTAEKTQ